MHEYDDAGFWCEVEEECNLWALYIYAGFVGEVNVDTLVGLSRSKTTGGDRKRIVSLKKEERRLKRGINTVKISV